MEIIQCLTIKFIDRAIFVIEVDLDEAAIQTV
jgi:hypothetical protein